MIHVAEDARLELKQCLESSPVRIIEQKIIVTEKDRRTRAYTFAVRNKYRDDICHTVAFSKIKMSDKQIQYLENLMKNRCFIKNGVLRKSK